MLHPIRRAKENLLQGFGYYAKMIPMSLDSTVFILLQGALLITSINCTIGPQNLLILRLGTRGQHLLPMVLTCVFCDLLLVGAGLLGLSSILAGNTLLLRVATWGGVLCLFYYGSKSLHAGWRGELSLQQSDSSPLLSLQRSLFAILAITLLNPGVYLQTVVMVGGVGSHYLPSDRWFFAIGVVLASTLWFVSLIYGAARLNLLFRRPWVGRSLDLASGAMMWMIAWSLLW